jgi:cell division protein FtsL
MNAAARLVERQAVGRVIAVKAVQTMWPMMALLLAVILSALSLIYVAHMQRELHANYQLHERLHDKLKVENGQLLLERGTLMVQSRIERLAESELGMVQPTHENTVMINV